MILTFRSKRLAALWLRDDASKLDAQQVAKIKQRLSALHAAKRPEDLDLPGYYFHALSGDRRGTYSIRVTANWRITFRWQGTDATEVDHEDYH